MENPETGRWKTFTFNEMSNPSDEVAAISEMNKDVVGDLTANQRAFQHGADEKFLIVGNDSNYKIAESPEELKEIYKNAGFPWEYNISPAIAPANAATAGK